jgi:hypothetical protein
MTNLDTDRFDNVSIGGTLIGKLYVPSHSKEKIIISGCPIEEVKSDVRGLAKFNLGFNMVHNAMVNQGLQDMLDSFFNDLVADRITHIGLSADSSAVTATTTSLDPGTAGSSIKAIANVARTNQTVHGDQTWTQADVSWAIRKIGFLTSSSAADVVNIIGGAGGSSPYDEDFTLDLTNIATWSLTMGIDLTATAS